MLLRFRPVCPLLLVGRRFPVTLIPVSSVRALLVVDVQRGFVTPDTEPVLEPITRSVRHVRANGQLVVATRFHNPDPGPFRRLMGWERLSSSPEVDLVPELVDALGPAAIVRAKDGYGALDPWMDHLLTSHGVDEVLLCGIDTDACVLATALQLFASNRRPVVLTDLCASTGGAGAHRAGLAVLRRLIDSRQLCTWAEALGPDVGGGVSDTGRAAGERPYSSHDVTDIPDHGGRGACAP